MISWFAATRLVTAVRCSIRKSCFADVGGFDEELKSLEDLDMWLRIAENSKTPGLWGSKYFLWICDCALVR
jgi:hypothetical protein